MYMLQDNFVDALMYKNCIFRNIAKLVMTFFYGWREHVSNQKRYDGFKGNLI